MHPGACHVTDDRSVSQGWATTAAATVKGRQRDLAPTPS